ncbi:MAG: hypothetical protein JSW11_11660 [Candidatus Heimdallarchaeota archaeon]|nr:MAG: hypothetical protein JSW11_11660 [Candidatus Heimdallarchaeota archaeon]
MEVVNFFGEKLANIINKNAVAASGIIRFVIKDSQYDPDLITVDELRVFSNSLKK